MSLDFTRPREGRRTRWPCGPGIDPLGGVLEQAPSSSREPAVDSSSQFHIQLCHLVSKTCHGGSAFHKRKQKKKKKKTKKLHSAVK